MNTGIIKKESILVSGKGRLTFSIVISLLKAGHRVDLYTQKKESAFRLIQMHTDDIFLQLKEVVNLANLTITEEIDRNVKYTLAIAITPENIKVKQAKVQELEKAVIETGIIGINTESIPLDYIQEGSQHPTRIIGLNWVEPAHTTFFLEIICNSSNNGKWVDDFCVYAHENWQKDPYVVRTGESVRGRMMSALIREAFYLVENGYVSYEDVDRACRNDAGYYLPFAGNFRYMDLMGTYIYGLVMKDMNPDLSTEKEVPRLFNQLMLSNAKGMDSKKGFYEYKTEEVENWDKLFREFSYQISSLMKKYPFEQKEILIGTEYKEEEAF